MVQLFNLMQITLLAQLTKTSQRKAGKQQLVRKPKSAISLV